MFRFFVYIVYLIVCAGAIATYVNPAGDTAVPEVISEHAGIVFFSILLVTQVAPLLDWLIPRKRVEIISAVYFGLLVGVLLSYLLMLAIEPAFRTIGMPAYYLTGMRMATTLIFTYLSITLILQTKDDFRFVIPYVEFARELKGGKPFVLDSSALIDGRIADVIDTRILDAKLLVPEFILKEIQDIADSNEKTRRMRGRRGLDVLARLQNSPKVEISVYDSNDRELRGLSVDQRLVGLAKKLGGRVVTNDFNLNKVAHVQGVDVVNLNEVANALKPRYLPGEQLSIRVIKEGESAGQGVGYLDDGTMVICEQGARHLDKEVEIVVTSVLQSSAGRMIFGKLGDGNS